MEDESLWIQAPEDRQIPANTKNLLLDLPVDHLIKVLSFLQPKEIDGFRSISRALNGFVDENRSSLPRHEGYISIKDVRGSKDIEIMLDIHEGDWTDSREVRLPFNDVSTLVPSLVGSPTDVLPAPLFPLLRPSLHLSRVAFGGDTFDHPESSAVKIYDVDIAALNDVLPPYTTMVFYKMILHNVTYETMKAVAVKRGLDVGWCAMPRWEEQEEAAPVTSNLVYVSIQDVHDIDKDSRNFVRAVLALSTHVEFNYFPNTPEGEREERDLMECLGKTAEFLELKYGPWGEANLLHLAGISNLICNDSCYSDNINTESIRKLVEKYLENGREASASLELSDESPDEQVASFYPLRSGFVGNSIASEAEQRDRKGICMEGDTFVFTNRFMSVRVRCTAGRYNDYFTFLIDASM